MNTAQSIESFHLLGIEIKNFLNGTSVYQEEWDEVLKLSEQENPWFTRASIIKALKGISLWLDKERLEKWLSYYANPPQTPKGAMSNWSSSAIQSPFRGLGQAKIGVILAGNIPLVGFHDFLCVLLSGNVLFAKLSHSDMRLLPFIADRLTEFEPRWKSRINVIARNQAISTSDLDAIIATGSNNTARHFEYYFRNIPHIIRKNRNGIAILDGEETPEKLALLGDDVFSYFGLGCRNVSKLYVPKGYIFDSFFKAIEKFGEVINHNKYHSNYVYNRTIYLMDGKKFTDNGFLLVIQSEAIPSPIAVLNFEEYDNRKELEIKLETVKEQIQCIVSKEGHVSFGGTQSPALMDYADGVDVMKFLLELK